MSAPRIGSLCSGYGGLDEGVRQVYGGETVWVSDIDKGANKILAHRYPDVPNLGDFTVLDWLTVEAIDILTAGFPCQPVSNAGKRLGDDDERWLWDDVARAVRVLRPGLVVLENVRGLLTAGDGRLFGRVLGTLAELGYDAQWHGLRAADIGAPHGRWRVFIVAADTRGEELSFRTGLRQGGSTGLGWGRPCDDVDAGRLLPTPSAVDGDGGRHSSPGFQRTLPGEVRLLSVQVDQLKGVGADVVDDGVAVGHPVASNERDARRSQGLTDGGLNGGQVGGGLASGEQCEGGHRTSLDAGLVGVKKPAVNLLPTPRAGDGEKGGPNQRGSSGDFMLPSAVTHLLPTPTSMDCASSGGGYNGQTNVTLTDATARQPEQWGQYAAAIVRWEALTRPAPPPTETGPKGNPRLSAAFSEWMMGLPAGWVTDVPGITRNEALKALGNGVVPQQAAAALRIMLAREVVAA